MKTLNKYKGTIKDQIFNLLSTPLTATDIKEKLPHVSSMGTILYHLANLKKCGSIIRDQQKHVRGKPTYYYWAMLKREGVKTWYELEQIQLKKKEKLQLKILKQIKEIGKADPEAVYQEFEDKGKDDIDDVQDFIFNNFNQYLKLTIEITEKGKEALKLNKIEQSKKEPPVFGVA